MGRASWPGIGRAGIRGLAAGSAGLAGNADFFTGITAFLAATFLLRTIFLTGFLLAAALVRAVIHFLRRPGRRAGHYKCVYPRAGAIKSSNPRNKLGFPAVAEATGQVLVPFAPFPAALVYK